ncbi:uncharacterized protein LOC113204757 [Frankliniella occidentalis]|uniref:Uncharacterized protein LOC113204757 n=1 Tax=Frankliniella occidentalis TaxID=133901 RepID=A0A9C6UB11_FRAOC|nr:uncharacterized protein LOC113204757 [Frankliniella occidentalis]
MSSTSGMNSTNSVSSRNGSVAPRPSVSSSSSSGGAMPKVKLRKKIPIHPNSFSLPMGQLPYQVDSQTSHHQFVPPIHQHIPTNGQFPNTSNGNSSQINANGLPLSSGCKNTPKTQLIFDWQTGEIPAPTYPHRNCRNRHTSSELYDSASDESVSQDNRHIVPGNLFRGILSEVNCSVDPQPTYQYPRLRMNGQDTGSGATPSLSSEVSSHSVALNNGTASDHQNRNSENKKINVPSSPDRAHVEHRLSQIQDYIKQTSSLIESYRLSGVGATDDSSFEFLVEVLKDLHDSEAKLKCLLSAYDQIIQEDDVKNTNDGTEVTSRGSQPQEPQVNGNDHSVNANGSAKSTDTRKQIEIKMKFEESLRQLHALQAEQALLIQKRSEAQEQLQEAQRARNILLAMSSNGCSVNTQGGSTSGTGSEDQPSDALLNNLQDVDRRPPSIRGKCQTQPNREFPTKKRQSADFQSDVTTYLKELLTGDEVKEQASSEDSAVEDAIDEYAEARAQVRLQGQIVQDKVTEINSLRAQLDQAKSLLNIAHRRDGRPHVSGNNSADEGVFDQVVNILQQRKGDGDAASPDSRKSKPTVKQQQLELERAKLGRLRGLLATVQEYRSSGLPIPEHILNEFGNETQPDVSQVTSHAQEAIHEEDAAAEADVEEDDEPESATQWNQQHLSLVESASMASELSHGLQQRAAQLQVERDGLSAMQRQLDGLFSQLQQPPSDKSPVVNHEETPVNTSETSSSPLHRPRSAQETKRADETVQRRMELLSDLHSRWQQLQDDIASDGELSVKAAPVLSATKSALNKLTHQILPENNVIEDNTSETTWDQGSLVGRRQTTPLRGELPPQALSQERQYYDGSQMSSAPSTLMRRRSPSDVIRNQRAVWSSANDEEARASLNNTATSLRYAGVPSEENPPIISMPSPSPSVLQHQQQTQEMKNRIAALSRSCQSLCLDSVEGINSSPALPLLPAVAIPPPPPPGSLSHDREAYYQQLLAAGQLQQQQVLLTAINQCFHILKLQQHELLNLSNSVHMLSSGANHVTPVGVHSSVLPGVHPAVNAVNAHQGVHQGVHPGVHHALLQSEEPWATPSPAPGPPTLNNQVPPGNRTNNYWDNFRSYSRQNLLSTSAKSNEGLPHSPSPLVERSHNSLRSSTPMSVPGPSSISVASSMPQYHTLSTPSCLPGAGSAIPQPPGLAEQGSAPMGAVGPMPPTTLDFSQTSLVHNISRNDKRNIDFTEGVSASPRRRPSNEIDHRTASRVLEDAALPMNCQLLSPTSQEFEVPAMPILRNSVSGLQTRLSQVNLNAPPSFANLQDFMDTQNTRHQLNNEGVPFSEISTSLSNQQFNEFHVPCSLENVRESSRRLNVDYHNGTTDTEPPSSTVLKRNTGAIKRTYSSSPCSSSNSTSLNPNIQRNIHSTPAVSQLSSSNASCNSHSEALFKSSKLQSGQDCSRNYNCSGRRPGLPEETQMPCSSSSVSSRTRMRGINETDDHTIFQHDHADDTEHEDAPLLRCVGFNNCQSSTSSQSTSSQNTSNVELQSLGPGKNHLKESCFQIRKCPKYQSKSGSRSPLSDTTAVAAAAVAVATVSQNSPSHRNVHSSSGKSMLSNSQRSVNTNTKEDYAVLNQMSGQGQLYEELRESVYSEMTSLISENGSRSHFLVQLLRDLQHISSDSVRQSVIQLIQQAVSRYQIDLSVLGQDGCTLFAEDEAEEDEEEAKRMESQRLERERLPYAGACSSSEPKGTSSSTQEGETLMQLVLGLELAAVLSGNADENCSPSLIDDVRSRIFQLIPMNQTLSALNTQAVNSPRSVSYVHSQIDNVLESVFLKFQGCRIGDVRNEITSCVVSALPIKLMYRSMVEYYSRNNMESESLIRRDGPVSFRESSSSPSVRGVSPNPLQYSQHTSTLSHQDGRDVSLLQEASNGDLAEADQSHHSINTLDGDGDSEADRDCSTDGPLSASVSESASGLLHVHVYQLGGVSEAIDSEPEVEALQEEGEVLACTLVDRNVCRDDMAGAVGGAEVDRNNVDDVSERWSLEQDQVNDSEKERVREQGLDQVPTRLACDSDRDQENGEKHRSHHLAMPPLDSST